MALKKIVDGAYLVPMGNANAYLLDAGPELVLVDAGFPGKAQLVFDALRELGRSPKDLKHLVLTHGHPDHIGSAAAIVKETGAATYLHPADIPFAESGGPFRPMTAGRGLMKIVFRLVWDQNGRTEPFRVDRALVDGETLPLAGGLRVVHLPGHCAGQVALVMGGDRLLIAGDVCTNILGLADPVGFEDEAEGRRSQREIALHTFDAAAFGHGSMIASGASKQVRGKLGL